MSTPRVQETHSVSNGENIIQIAGNYETAIFVNGTPIAMDWACGTGSVDHYLLRANVPERTVLLEEHRFVVDGGFDSGKSLGTQFAPVLRLFCDGEYALTLSEAGCDEEWDQCEFEWKNTGQHKDQVYPLGRTFVCTRPTESLDQKRIAELCEFMTCGVDPIVITASNGSRFEYVIDGHHKLKAYQSRRSSPKVLNVLCAPSDFDKAVFADELHDSRLKKFFNSQWKNSRSVDKR